MYEGNGESSKVELMVVHPNARNCGPDVYDWDVVKSPATRLGAILPCVDRSADVVIYGP